MMNDTQNETTRLQFKFPAVDAEKRFQDVAWYYAWHPSNPS